MSDGGKKPDVGQTEISPFDKDLAHTFSMFDFEKMGIDPTPLRRQIKAMRRHGMVLSSEEIQYAVEQTLTRHLNRLAQAAQVDSKVGTAGRPPIALAAPPAPPAPPRIGEALIALFCKRAMREAVLGDLDEKFAELAGRRGARVAKAWYWGQAGRSVLFFAVRWGRRLLELEAILKRIL